MTDEQAAARIAVIRTAARYMQDTDDDFFTTLGKWLAGTASLMEDGMERVSIRERVCAYEIADAYFRSRDRLTWWGRR